MSTFIQTFQFRFFFRYRQGIFSNSLYLSKRIDHFSVIRTIRLILLLLLIVYRKKREFVQDLAPMLWHSFGTIAALLQEIVSIYPSISPPTLNAYQSNRVCNALALLQCVASHQETRSAFLQANIPLFLYPFLHTTSKTRPFEYLRLTSLGVIGALVKV